MPGSASGTPLVPRRRKRRANKDSWWTRHVTKPLSVLNPATILARRRKPSTPRSIFINQQLPADYFDKAGRPLKSKSFCTNQNITSKYTILTFLPRNLLEQFRRVANIFFLFINVLQFFPKFSTISPGLVILPLIVVLGVTAIKDGYEDVKRHQADRKVNYSVVHVLGGGDGQYVNANPMEDKEKTFVRAIPMPKRKSKKEKSAKMQANADLLKSNNANDLERQHTIRSQVSTWDNDPEAGDSSHELGWQRIIWEDVKVGDIIKIYDNEPICADIIVCSTSEEEDVCYVETKGLDGETNLKSRHAVPGITHLDSIQACATTKMRIDMDAPEVNMYRLNGAIILPGEEGDVTHPITLDTCLLRGCALRNTSWVIGIVAFTGDDTKIIQNSGRAPSKRSRVERQMNPQVIFNLFVLGIISMICAVIGHHLEKIWTPEGAYWMLYNDTSQDNPNINGLWTFFNALITFQNIIPISLYLSIEFVRTVQAAFIFWDHQMHYVKNGQKIRTTARSWNLSDDLGQVEYIFSDKTGTLTQNVMVFRQCSVGGKIYYGDEPEVTAPPKKAKPVEDTMSSSDDNSNSTTDVASVKRVEAIEIPPFRDRVLTADLSDVDSEQSRILHGFFVVLGLCHTALASESETGQIMYKSQSPDEAALVQSAAEVGFVFLGRDRNILRLKTPYAEQPDEYELLNVLEFNSTRKRMSVIVRKCDDQGTIFVLSKGADNVIFDLLNKKDDSQAALREKTDKDLQVFASQGLRTLCLAYRVLEPAEYETWAKEYHEAEVSLNDREGRMENVMAQVEINLQLLGATAIEDKLQDGVPETIADLKRAGINIWVATGDKLETAVAIGYTTNLLTADSNLIIIRQGNHSIHDQLRDSLEGFFGDDLRRSTSLMQLETRNSTYLNRVNSGVHSLVGDDNGHRSGGFSLVIEGSALAQIFDDVDNEDLLIQLALKCNTVICCRVSPLQKAQIVKLIKDSLGVLCLAVGDGANDVSMIQAADVGVGISGEEGLQAVNSADYATGQFRFLKRLLLVHGHWSYFRNGTMIVNFFYKNVIGIGILFWYMFFCGWSTTFVYAYVYLLFWNVFWTLCPVIAIGIFERNADDRDLMALPELYRYSREHRYYNWPRFLYYLFEGVYQTAVGYFILHYAYVTTTTRGDGWEVYKDEMSTAMAVAAVMYANLFSGLNIDAWSWWVVFAVWVGPFLIWVFTPIYSTVPPTTYVTGVYGNDIFLFRSAAFWFGWLFVTIMALLPRYLIKFAKQNIFPNDIDVMRLVRKYQPDVDPYTDPMLGGRLDRSHDNDNMAIGRVHSNADLARRTMVALEELTASAEYIPPTEYPPRQSSQYTGSIHGRPGRPSVDSSCVRPSLDSHSRPSFQSTRLGMAGGIRGSQVDMATGLTREPSRGFGFDVEEGGVAIKRMQSSLSQHSSVGRPRYTLRRLAVQNRQNNAAAPSPNSALKSLRTRAGSMLRGRNRSSTVNTEASTQQSADDFVPPLAQSPPRSP
ncbi:hypothetical protein CspeluHIS016_0401990 [Cutaneotrichosporon spelunceum]|uniref:Phospholipid-transporting ATPase n=1 Tax=Cutaneotrichosporon spelunceum TaxID=1672016 RepID=A0AAD3YBS9_9TREE|nr:hypothetical protein CspeluHIS016_0401990 [Cutaneotrichosporon spelunceum]